MEIQGQDALEDRVSMGGEAPDAEAAEAKRGRNEAQFKSGASWFYWLAGLSVINSIIVAFGGSVSFLFGLGATQIVDAIALSVAEDAPETAGAMKFVGLGVSLLIAGIFVLLGWLARKRYQWAYVIGIALYFLDALLFVFVQDWLGLAFHGWVLFSLFMGFKACRELAALDRAAAPAPQGLNPV